MLNDNSEQGFNSVNGSAHGGGNPGIAGSSSASNQHQQSASTGNPSTYVVSVSQSKKYLFSFMMKDSKNEPII